LVTKPTGRPNGRPPLAYDPVIGEEICDAIAQGGALHVICRVKGYPSTDTVYKWLNSSPEFAEKYARAREIQQDRAADEIIEIADRATDPQKARNQIDARKWRASKLAPKKYGDRVDMNLTATIENTPQEQLDARIIELLGKAGVAAVAGGERAPEIEGQIVPLRSLPKTG
jgi:hypothetical protein